MMDATPRFLNGVFDFVGRGLGRPAELDPALSYTVPSDKRTQLIYLRAGNSLDELVYLVLTKNGAPDAAPHRSPGPCRSSRTKVARGRH